MHMYISDYYKTMLVSITYIKGLIYSKCKFDEITICATGKREDTVIIMVMYTDVLEEAPTVEEVLTKAMNEHKLPLLWEPREIWGDYENERIPMIRKDNQIPLNYRVPGLYITANVNKPSSQTAMMYLSDTAQDCYNYIIKQVVDRYRYHPKTDESEVD